MLVTIDFETFYSKDVGFKKQTTEEYINDPQFHVIGMGIKINDGETRWVSGDDAVRRELVRIDWSTSAVLAHNTLFDGAILSWRFGVVPAFYFDTLCMARAIHGVDAGGSLAALATRYGIGQKGDEVVNALGKRLCDFDEESLARYGEYCINDVELTYKLFHKLAAGLPESELDLVDMTLRMYTQPVFQINEQLLLDRLKAKAEEKRALLGTLTDVLECTEEELSKNLSSNRKFADVLQRFGVPAPMKTSPTTGKDTYAFAKNDEEFIALQEHEDFAVQQLCAARLGTKSTLEESRIQRFIDVGRRNGGKIPVPLKYYGAHTGRWAGSDAINFQNLPSRDKTKKALKNAIAAPDGHVVINCDSSQIEARVLAWLAGQNDVVGQFARGEDVYSIFASKVYGFEVSKAHPTQRFVGKTCVLGLGYGTGAKKLRHTLATQPPGADVSDDEAQRMVELYRTNNSKITDLWSDCGVALRSIMGWDKKSVRTYLGEQDCVIIERKGVRLPNGLHIHYPDLQERDRQLIYKSRKGVIPIWGGGVTENVVQALARIIVGEQMRWISREFRVALTVHDSAVLVVPKCDLDAAKEYIELCMSTPPSWAAGLPVACELTYAETYGEC